MTTATDGPAATTSDPLPTASTPSPVNLVLRRLALATMIVLGTGVGYVLALILAFLSGIIPMGLC